MSDTPTAAQPDHNHILPDRDWAQVVKRAKELEAEQLANAAGGASPLAGPIIDMRGRSGKNSGVSGIPTQLLVLHSAECPLAPGYAQSLTEWAITSNVVASWHRFIGPDARVYMIDDNLAAWHASEANPMSIGWEQAGYAKFARDEWLTPNGLLQIDSLAYDMAQVALRDGIPAVWLTTDQVTAVTTYGDRKTKGFCLHRQIDPETRTDPGGGYPYDLLMEKIKFHMGQGGIAPQGNTTNQTSTPNSPTEEDTEMLYLCAPGDGKIWLSNGVQKWHVPDPAHVVHIQTLAGWGALKVYGNGKVLEAPAMGADNGTWSK